MCPVSCLESGLDYLQSRQQSFLPGISSSRGHGLVILRICNELLRRLPKSSSSEFSGKILHFLSVLFPYGERSGLNLRGDVNLDNVTFIDDPPEMHDESADYSPKSVQESLNSPGRILPYRFYQDFWKLQYFFLHPVQSTLPENWNRLTKVRSLKLAKSHMFRL